MKLIVKLATETRFIEHVKYLSVEPDNPEIPDSELIVNIGDDMTVEITEEEQ